jgi:hypothetical protein
MSRKRVHILSTVNAGAVSKAGGTYTIRDVCGAVDGIVMNRMLYPAEQLAEGVATLSGKPAPAGHPKDAEGRFISALNGDALLKAYAGAICRNARHEGGRTLVDIEVNEAQARAHPDGLKLVERLDAAIAGTNAEPIHVSTGLFCEPITANGESAGKAYDRIATRISYDHMAFLLHERGAGTPEEGIGMFLNAAGQPEPVEEFEVNLEPQDKRSAGALAWARQQIARLLGNGSDLSFDQISDGLYKGLPEHAWLREVFDRYAIWTDRDGKLWKQDYTVSSDGSVAWSGTAVEVTRKVKYEPVTNRQEGDPVKDKILAALNAAGIKTEGLDDAQLLTAYNALVTQPVKGQLDAANAKVSEFEANAQRAQEAELTELATALAANSTLTVDDLKKLGLDRLKAIKASAKGAAPVVLGNSGAGGNPADEFKGYSLNSHFEETK